MPRCATLVGVAMLGSLRAFAACDVAGVPRHLSLTVGGDNLRPFVVQVAATPALASLASTPIAVAVSGQLVFGGTAARSSIQLSTRTPITVASGMLHLTAQVSAELLGANSSNVVVRIPSFGSDEGVSIPRVELPCSVLTLDEVGEAPAVDNPGGQQTWHARAKELVFYPKPEQRSGLPVQLSPPVDIELLQLEARPGWVLLRLNGTQGPHLVGWVRRSDVRRVRPSPGYGRGAGGLGSRRASAPACRSVTAFFEGDADVTVGAQVFAEPDKGPWATVGTRTGLRVRLVTSDARWVAVVGARGISTTDCGELEHAWIRRDAVTLPEARPTPEAPGTWTRVPDHPGPARTGFTTTLLDDGTVLMAGGRTESTDVAVAALYSPRQRAWTEIAAMNKPRSGHTATLLTDGRVLVVGGDVVESARPWTMTSELYDPRHKTWTLTRSPSVASVRHVLVRLPDGRALLSGGSDFDRSLDRTEVYDAVTASWLPGPTLLHARSHHTGTLLSDGSVLVVGGRQRAPWGGVLSDLGIVPEVERLDPVTQHWHELGRPELGRADHVAVRLADDRVVFLGGFQAPYGKWPLAVAKSVLVYDHGAWRNLLDDWNVAERLAHEEIERHLARVGHTVTVLPDGRWLLVGGDTSIVGSRLPPLIYDPAHKEWSTAGTSPFLHLDHTATLLPDGTVLFVGSHIEGPHHARRWTTSVELYVPTSSKR